MFDVTIHKDEEYSDLKYSREGVRRKKKREG